MGLDINLFRPEKGGNLELVRQSLRKRFQNEQLVDEVVQADSIWRKSRFALDSLNKDLGVASRLVAEKKKASKGKDPCTQEIASVAQIKAQILEAEQSMLGHVGNLVHESVPIGKPQEPNPVLRQWGQKEQKHSLEQDLERGEKVAGPGNYFLLGQSVLLKLKLINEATAFFSACGYSLIQPPLFVRGVATQLSSTNSFRVYHKKKEKHLVSSGEQVLTAMYSGEWLDDKRLPIRLLSFSHIFHSGRKWDTMTQLVLCDGVEASWKLFEQLTSEAEQFLQRMHVPYQLSSVVSGQLPSQAAAQLQIRKGDITAATISNLTDFTARTLEIRAGIKKPETNYIKEAKRYAHIVTTTWELDVLLTAL